MLLFPLSGRFDRVWSTTSGCTPDTRTEGGAGWMEGCSTEDRWRWREGGADPFLPGMCVRVTSQRDAAAQKGGNLYLSHSDISCSCWFLWGFKLHIFKRGRVMRISKNTTTQSRVRCKMSQRQPSRWDLTNNRQKKQKVLFFFLNRFFFS